MKQGTENMIDTYHSSTTKDKKLLQESQLMLNDAKRKIEYIRMQIARLSNQQMNSVSAESNGCKLSLAMSW